MSLSNDVEGPTSVADTVLNGRYRLIGRIGSGGMAEVHKAIDEVLGRTVAVKTMRPQFAEDPTFAERFQREARAAAGLRSPNVVTIHDWGSDDGVYYMVMEYLEGEDLQSMIRRGGPLTSVQAADIGAQVASALSVAHAHGVIHRDVTSRNIMVEEDGSVKLTDFGIALAGSTGLTQDGSVLGSAHYFSPEQAQGLALTPASDLYSLGVVLFEAVTGRLPFEAESPITVALKHVNEPPPRPRSLAPGLDPGFEALILKALAKLPEDRFGSADEMRDALTALARELPPGVTAELPAVAETPPPQATADTAVLPAERAASTPRRVRLWPWLLVAAVIAGIGLVLAQTVFAPEPVMVPKVIGMSSSEAKSALERSDLAVGTVRQVFDPKSPKGTVTSQSPRGGASVRAGAKVDLTVSGGPRQSEVPDVIGLASQQARDAIERVGLVAQSGGQEFSSSVDSGVVLRQQPPAGATVAQGSQVLIVLSAGPAPQPAPGDGGKGGKTRGKGKNKGGD